MSSLTVYGDPESSRAWWNTWMCRELNLDFDNVPLRFLDPEIKSDEYRAVNPNGFIPTIKDGEFKLFESMAINLYLAKKSGSMFYPESLEEEALAWQWSFWAVTRIEVPLLTLFVANLDHPPESELGQYFLKHIAPWTSDEIARCKQFLQEPFRVLNEEFASRPHLLGNGFTVADLNVSVILSRNNFAQVDLSSFPNLADWLTHCWSRPACPRSKNLLETLDSDR